MEADLQRYYGVDLADLWRGRLSLRKISVLVTHLPPGSAVWATESDLDYGWTLTDILLSDVFHALAGEAHPARPKPQKAAQKQQDGNSMIERLKAQRARYNKGGSND